MRVGRVLNKYKVGKHFKLDIRDDSFSFEIDDTKVRKNKDRYNRYWRHLDLFGVRTYLRYSIRRVVCRRCGVVREKVPWADKGSRFTKSFEQEVAWLAQRTDVSAVANYFRVTWRSVRRIIQRVVAEQRDERRELDGLRVIGMDEISYRKRHKYLTVVIDHLSGRVVWAGKERKAKTLLRFFRKRVRYVSTTLRHSRAAFSEPRLASGGSWRRCGPHLHRSRSRFVEQKKGVPQVWTPPREWLVRHSGASFSPSAG